MDWNRGDVTAFMRGYWKSPQTEFVNTDGILHGWEAMLDRYRKSYPDRDGSVASVQRQEKARHTLEGARAFQKEGGLNTGTDVLDVSDTLCQIGSRR